jgi:hypothetical protein
MSPSPQSDGATSQVNLVGKSLVQYLIRHFNLQNLGLKGYEKINLYRS